MMAFNISVSCSESLIGPLFQESTKPETKSSSLLQSLNRVKIFVVEKIDLVSFEVQ